MTAAASDFEILAAYVRGRNLGAVLAEIPDHGLSPADHRLCPLAHKDGMRGDPDWSHVRPDPTAARIKRFRPRRYQRSPNRAKSRERRRGLACNYGYFPSQIRNKYTEAEAAVLAVYAMEFQTKGYCDLHVDAIASKAGVSKTTVHNARRRACELGHILHQERKVDHTKNKTNMIYITSSEWRAWIQHRPKTATGCKTFSAFKSSKISHPTKTISEKKEGYRAKQEEFPRVARIFRVSG
jgi:hypothetical protein